MHIETQERPVMIKLIPGESVIVTSAIMVQNDRVDCTNKSEVTVKVYSDFFVIENKTNKGLYREVYSDNWDFRIKGK